MPHILVLYAHPMHHYSRVNRRMREAAQTVPDLVLHDLYEMYPDFHIDIEYEKKILSQADLIVFQHPVQWYSMPSLLKEWVDTVLEDGWAYGSGGNALRGKDFWLATTAGAARDTYQKGAYHGYPFAEFLPAYKQLAVVCGMRWLPPFVLHGASRIDDAMIDTHAQSYREKLATYPVWTSETSIAGSSEHANEL